MKYYFIDDKIKNDFNINVIKNLFPNLQSSEGTLLLNSLLDIVDLIAIKFHFDLTKRDLYEDQFRQNNYRDPKGIVLMLLPFIDDTDGTKKKNIKTLNDIYVVKKKGSTNELNQGEPKYEYSNLQYGRCNRTNMSETQFSAEHLKHNLYLLRQTINTVANKLYVNWMDIRPVHEDDKLYDEINDQTMDRLRGRNMSSWDITTEDEDRYYQGLDTSEIYNCMANFLYDEIRNIKFLIYDRLIDGKNHIMIYLYSKLFSMDSFVKNISHNRLSEVDRNKFDVRWKNIINAIRTNGILENIPSDTLKYMFKVLLIFFESNDKLFGDAKEDEYVPLRETEDEEEDEEEDAEDKRASQIRDDDLVKSIQTLKSQYIYDFFKQSIQKFMSTYYAREQFKYKDGVYTYIGENNPLFLKVEPSVTFKNLYNFAKSLVHVTVRDENKQRYIPLPKHWIHLTNENKKVILSRINGEDQGWFNIMRYIKYTYGETGNMALQRNKNIMNAMYNEFPTTTLDVLINKGLLTQFKPESMLTDQRKLPESFKEMIDEIKNRLKNIVFKGDRRKIYDNSIYFINNMPYETLNITYKDGDRQETVPYLDYMWKNLPGIWTTTYAMDWISQISFFHHYLNNQIIYVTGATGVGKSTQVPKLLLYALKMLNYNDSGQCVCTQPRIPPTKGNARSISEQMGIPIEEYNSSLGSDIPTRNYNIQYQTAEEKHAAGSPGLTLKIVTDGLLFQQLKSNPIAKKRVYNKTTDSYNYRQANIYDVIIVDEAHEHNANMDFILSIMKYTAYYNNSVKLVIISATMDEDEPNYRRYYRDINDNQMFPINTLLYENSKGLKLDRINVDRRFHISPPGQTTRFTIEDNYMPDADPEELIKKLAIKSRDQDILLFKPGTFEISQSVKKLNEPGFLPPDTIALPYHGQMDDKKKKFIEKINQSAKKDIVMPRDKNFETFDPDLYETVPKGTYTKVIIVATNIAEASITIPTLGYVVDTGTQKTAEYDYVSRDFSLNVTPISESSRMQRRGRVGRVASGEVYYLYPKGSMVDNKTKFNISISNISENIYDLLKDGLEEELFRADPRTQKLIAETITEAFKNDLSKFIKLQYFSMDAYLDYYGDDTQYDYNNRKKPNPYYKTGFSNVSLRDNNGTFYIIHPDELKIRRNITGRIVGLVGDEKDGSIQYSNNAIISQKILTFIESLTHNSLIFQSLETADYIKTSYGLYMMNLKGQLKLLDPDETGDVVTYLYSRKYGVNEQIVKLLPMLRMVMRSGVKSLFLPYDKTDPNKGRLVYENMYGDANGLLKMVDGFLGVLKHDIFKEKQKQFTKQYIRNLEELKKRYIHNRETKNFSGMDKNLVEIFIKLDNEDKLKFTEKIDEDELDNYIDDNINVNIAIQDVYENKSLERYCEQTNLNIKSIRNYIKEYYLFQNKLFKINAKIVEVDPLEKDYNIKFTEFDKMLDIVSQTDTEDKKIIKSLLHGHGFKLAKRMDGSKLFVLLNSINLAGVVKIKSVNPKAPHIYDSLIQKYIGDYVMFFGRDGADISLIQNVDPVMVQQCVPYIYTPQQLKAHKFGLEHVRKDTNAVLKLMSMGKSSEMVDELKIPKIYETGRIIINDMLNSYNPLIWTKLQNLENDQNKKEQYIRYLDEMKTKQTKSVQAGGQINQPIHRSNIYNMNNLYIRYLASKMLKYNKNK